MQPLIQSNLVLNNIIKNKCVLFVYFHYIIYISLIMADFYNMISKLVYHINIKKNSENVEKASIF
jgi:hypothetical protein